MRHPRKRVLEDRSGAVGFDVDMSNLSRAMIRSASGLKLDEGRTSEVRKGLWLLAAAVLIPWMVGSAWPQPSKNSTAAAKLVPELTNIVQRHGWPADMARMCVAMKLGKEADCKFKQISVSASEPGTVDNHGFNVPLGDGPVTYIVIFHLGPLVGNFFVVSPDGELKAAFYRAKGVDYTKVPLQDARRAFDASMAFWNDNLPMLKKMIAKGPLPQR